MTADDVKARVAMLALRRGYGVTRIERVVWLVDRDGGMRELCRAQPNGNPWRTALEVLEAAT